MVGVSKSSLLGEPLLLRCDENELPRFLVGVSRAGLEDPACADSIACDGACWRVDGDCCCWATNLKMWTVSVALDTARRDDVALKDMQYI